MRYLRYLKTKFENCRKSNKPLIINQDDINALNLSTTNYNNQYPIDDIELLENIIRLLIILIFNKHLQNNYIPNEDEIKHEINTILQYGEFIEQDFLFNTYQSIQELIQIDFNNEKQNSYELFKQLITKMYNFENTEIINNIKIKY